VYGAATLPLNILSIIVLTATICPSTLGREVHSDCIGYRLHHRARINSAGQLAGTSSGNDSVQPCSLRRLIVAAAARDHPNRHQRRQCLHTRSPRTHWEALFDGIGTLGQPAGLPLRPACHTFSRSVRHQLLLKIEECRLAAQIRNS
jgi:hypothetical protein